MTVAGVQINLKDESSYIPSGSSIFAGMAGPFKKGPLEPTLCTSQAQFLSWFTEDGKPKVSYDENLKNACQTALDYLADADALWVVRAVNSTEENKLLYGGALVKTVTNTTSYETLASGIENLDNYQFTSADHVLLVAGCNPGTWCNNINITIVPNTTEGLENVYTLTVGKATLDTSGTVTKVVFSEVYETHTISFDPLGVDGYGNNIYAENVINGNSNYIMVKINSDATTKSVVDNVSLGTLTKGADGDTVDVSAMETAIDKLKNYEELPLQLLLDSGFSDESGSYAKYLLDIAGGENNRKGECFCVLSAPKDKEKITDITNYRKSITGSNNYLGSLYAPHVKIYDRFNDRYTFVAPTGMVANKINAAVRDFGYNFPAAGYTRGLLNSAIDVSVKYESGDLKLLDQNQINPIKNDSTRGIVIMGNSTLHPIASDKQDQNNMLVISLQIKPGLREFLKDYLFELNDEITRDIIVTKINLFMKDIVAQRGVSDFYVVCDSTNNSPNDVAAGILNISLYVKMVKAIKFIKCNIIATAQGLDFGDFA